jgi:enoyl-CoA hydratase
MAHKTIIVERDPTGYAVITLNRPDKLNALSKELRGELTEAIDAEGRAGSRVLILTGAGRAFTAGLDLKEIGAQGRDQSAVGGSADPVAAIGRFEGPVIAAVNGVAVTGGFEIALACDLILASEEARFADTHARIGLLSGWGLSTRLSRRIGIGRAKELSLSGNFLDARTAERWGLVNRVVPAAELLPQARQLARDMLSCLPHMLVAYKRLIDDGYALSFGDATVLEAERSMAFNARISGADVEQIRAGVFARGKSQSGG